MPSQEIFKKIVTSLETNRDRKLAGKYNSIISPFKSFNDSFPGLERGKYHIVTASSGIGKTKFTKYFFVTNTYRFCKKFGIPFKIYYFALEETENDFWLSFIATELYSTYNIKVDSSTLKSMGGSILTEDLLKKVKEIEVKISDMMNYISVIDNTTNPFGIYKYVREQANLRGKTIGEGFNTSYVPNDPEEYCFVMTDHISLLSPEKDPDTGEKMNKWETISKFSQDYCLKGFCKRWNYIVVNVQQQEAAKEKQEYTFKGNSIEDKLEPSLDSLATNKETQREADIVWGVFAPDRYKIETYRGYDITKFKDSYRAVKILKDRDYGLANGYLNLYMNGATNFFKQLPNSKEINYNDFLS